MDHWQETLYYNNCILQFKEKKGKSKKECVLLSERERERVNTMCGKKTNFLFEKFQFPAFSTTTPIHQKDAYNHSNALLRIEKNNQITTS